MKLCELAQRLSLPWEGSAELEVHQLASLKNAGVGDLSFVVSALHKEALINTKASAVLVTPALAEFAPCPTLVCDSPYLAYATASWVLHPDLMLADSGVAESASIHADAHVHESAVVGEFAVIEQGAVVEEHVVIGAHCTVGAGAKVGAHTCLMPRVVLAHGCELGEHCRVQSGAVIGSEGFGFAPSNKGWQAIHQIGAVRVGNRVHIGANTTIDRGAMDDTEVADGVILDNQIQIAHNVKIGKNTAIAGCVGIAGSTVIGASCQIGGACNIVGHLSIADGVVLNAASTITQSITEPGRYGSAVPLMPVSRWRRAYIAFGQLDGLMKRVRKLEQK